MTGRIEAVFNRLKKPAFISFTVAGDPDKETCIRAALALIDGGTDFSNERPGRVNRCAIGQTSEAR